MANVASSEQVDDERVVVGPPAARLTGVSVAPGNYRLGLRFAGEREWRYVDLTGVIYRYKAFRPLRDPDVFRKAKKDLRGHRVAWRDCDLDYGAEALKLVAEEQADMNGPAFRDWLERNRLSNQNASDIFGLSVATIQRYKRDGAPPLLRMACRAMDAEPLRLAAHFRPRKPGRPRKVQ